MNTTQTSNGTLDSMRIMRELGFQYPRYAPVNVSGTVHEEMVVLASNLSALDAPSEGRPVFATSSLGFGSSGASATRSSGKVGFHACHAPPVQAPNYLTPQQIAGRISAYFCDPEKPYVASVKVTGVTLPPISLAVCLEEDVDMVKVIGDLTQRTSVHCIIAAAVNGAIFDYAKKCGYDLIAIEKRTPTTP